MYIYVYKETKTHREIATAHAPTHTHTHLMRGVDEDSIVAAAVGVLACLLVRASRKLPHLKQVIEP
jgi:hypothetical protein